MSDLTERLRALAEKCWEYPYNIDVPLTDAADALEAAEAELARLEHQIQQAEEATSAAYKDAEIAEAKLAAIDALHHHCTDGFKNDWCAADAEVWPCRTHRILHPEEAR